MKNKLNHIKLGFAVVLVVCMLLGTSLILQAETQILQWDYLTPDLLITNGKIITVDENFSIAEALAIKDNRIVAVGKTADILNLKGPKTEILDLQGKTVIPGLQDSHIHFLLLGSDLLYKINLGECTSVEQITNMVKEKVSKTKPDDWVLGICWDWMKIQKEKQGAMADRLELDAVSPNNPVYLSYIEDGFALNTLAMKKMGYDETWEFWKKDPDWTDELNYIERFTSGPHQGEPTGVFYGHWPCDTMLDGLPPEAGTGKLTLEQKVDCILAAQEAMLACGVTSVIEPGGIMDISHYQKVYNDNKLDIRVTCYSGNYGWGDLESVKTKVARLTHNNMGDDHLRWRGAKFFADGGIGSLDGAVSEPYIFAKPNNLGVLVQEDDQVRLEQYRVVANLGWELHTHATGDRGITQTVRLYEQVMNEVKAKNPNADLRYSVIHNFLGYEPNSSAKSAKDMARLGIIAMVNSVFYYGLGDSFTAFIGEERESRFCPVNSLIKAGVKVAEGSDYKYAVYYDPWLGMFAMVERIVGGSRSVYGPEERVSIEEALKTFTINGAYLTYDENKRGSLEPGKYADLVVLNKDILTMNTMELETMKDEVLMTLVDGKVVWESPKCDLTIK
jgi:predicted amidohydrolase YtcJ